MNKNQRNQPIYTDAFLGTGWTFPPVLTDDGIQMVPYEEDIRQSLHILLSTTPGERVNRYDYGCPLHRYAFEPIDMQISLQMQADITRSVTLYEPRVELEDITFEPRPTEALLLIRLTYIIIRTNSRSNIVYPFYLNEGTNVNL